MTETAGPAVDTNVPDVGTLSLVRSLERIALKLDEIDRRSLETQDFVFGKRHDPNFPSLMGRLLEVERQVKQAGTTVKWIAGPSLVTLIGTAVLVYTILGQLKSDDGSVQALIEAISKAAPKEG